MSGGWWRRNAIPLVAVAVLLPLTAGVVAVNEWSEYDLGHATKPVTVPAGDSADYAGAVIGPARAEFASDDAAPEGTRVVTATVLVTPGDEPIACLSPVLRELDGAHRQWNEASFELDRDFSDDRRTSCDSEMAIRYSLSLDYLVPDDATGPFTIDLESGAGLPRYVSLVIAPER